MFYKCSRGNDTRHEESWVQGLHQGPLQRQVWRRHVTSSCQDRRGRVLPEDRGIIRVIFVYLQLHTNNQKDEIELFGLKLGMSGISCLTFDQLLCLYCFQTHNCNNWVYYYWLIQMLNCLFVANVCISWQTSFISCFKKGVWIKKKHNNLMVCFATS